MSSTLPLLVLVRKGRCEELSGTASGGEWDGIVSVITKVRLLDRDTHVTTITSFATVTLVFADTAFDTNTSILAASTRSLTVATFLALATSLTTRLG